MNGNLYLTSVEAIDEAVVELAVERLAQSCQAVSVPAHLTGDVIEVAFLGAKDLPPNPESYVGSAKVDANIRLNHQPLPKLFVADMDSTMIGQECIDELADYAGVKDEISRVTEAAMRGELDFEDALRSRVALLKGLPETVLEQCYQERITPNPGAAELLACLKANGVRTVLVSGGFTFFASRIAKRLGFDRFVANELEIRDGLLTGNVVGDVVDRARKATELRSEANHIGADFSEAIAIGDGSNDADMLDLAGYKVAYKAKPMLNDLANIRLQYSRLDQLLPLIGIRT